MELDIIAADTCGCGEQLFSTLAECFGNQFGRMLIIFGKIMGIISDILTLIIVYNQGETASMIIFSLLLIPPRLGTICCCFCCIKFIVYHKEQSEHGKFSSSKEEHLSQTLFIGLCFNFSDMSAKALQYSEDDAYLINIFLFGFYVCTVGWDYIFWIGFFS